MAQMREKTEPGFGEGGTFKPGGENGDLEGRRASTTVQGRKMSRIAPPRTDSLIDGAGPDEDYGKLVAMEADNAIKYRTCSWPKVIHENPSGLLETSLMKMLTDCCFTFCRVHLLGNHVVSLFILGSWSGTWHYLDGCSGCFRSLHVLDRLGVSTRPPPRSHEAWMFLHSPDCSQILPPSSGSDGRLRHRPNALLELEMGVVVHCCYVRVEQHLHSGSSRSHHFTVSKHYEQYVTFAMQDFE